MEIKPYTFTVSIPAFKSCVHYFGLNIIFKDRKTGEMLQRNIEFTTPERIHNGISLGIDYRKKTKFLSGPHFEINLNFLFWKLSFKTEKTYPETDDTTEY